MTSLQDRVNQLFTQTFGGALAGARTGRCSHPISFRLSTSTKMITAFTLQAEAPGVHEKDLDIRLENNILTISGERKLENEEKKENFHRIER